MAKRPVFLATASQQTVMVDFDWYPGFSLAQKQRSVAALHEAAKVAGLCQQPLEVSRRSSLPLGVALSAFNLQIQLADGRRTSVECAFQSSKVFAAGGPFLDLLGGEPAAAKRDPRLKDSGPLQQFVFEGVSWPLQPTTAFYDWLYISALSQSTHADAVLGFDAYTDIEFNPAKSLNCQAHACALFHKLSRKGTLAAAMAGRDAFIAALAA